MCPLSASESVVLYGSPSAYHCAKSYPLTVVSSAAVETYMRILLLWMGIPFILASSQCKVYVQGIHHYLLIKRSHKEMY